VVFIAWLLGCGFGGAEPEVAEDAEVAEPAPAPTEPAAPEGPLAASHVLVAHVGAVGVDPSVTRTEAEAHALATELYEGLLAGAPLETVAANQSDDAATAHRAGRIGAFTVEAVDPAFAEAVAGVAVGEYTEPFHTPFGWHVARRDAAPTIRARHILVPYEGALHSSETHSAAHARRMMDMLSTRLDRGADFAELAAEHSRDTTADHGGDLGPVGDGQLLPVLEEAIRKLKPGERTYVESPYGWHLVERTE